MRRGENRGVDPDTVSARRNVLVVFGIGDFMVESEGHVHTQEIVVKSLPGLRVAELTSVAASLAAGFTVVDLPPVDKVAAIVHRGSMERILPVEQAPATWLEENGYRSLGYPREVNLECPPEDHEQWVTELQVPVC